MVIETITERGVLSNKNNIVFKDGVNNKAYNLSQGMSSSATLSTITLESGADNEYNGKVIEIIYGNGKNQSRVITNITSLVATVSPNWEQIPNASSVYIIHIHSGQCQEQIHNELDCYVTLGANASSIDNFYVGSFIKILHGNGQGQIAEIIEYDGSVKLACLEPILQVPTLSNSIYAIYGEGGLASSATLSTIVLDGNQSGRIGQYHYIEIIKGSAQGEVRMINSILGNTITINSNWKTIPDNTSRYVIYGGWAPNTYENVVRYTIITTAADIDIHEGERAIIDLESSMDVMGSYELRNITELSSKVSTTSHALTVIAQFFRLKVVSMGTALNGSIQTILNSYKSGKITSQMEEIIYPHSDCELNRSVIAGKTSSGNYQNILADSQGNLSVNIRSPVDGFGAVNTTQPRQFNELMFLNNFVNPTQVKVEVQNNGTVTALNNICNVSSGSNDSGKATMYSMRRLRYTPGLASTLRFTGIFSSPMANSTQLIGLGDSCDGLFFGYNNVKFGILLRRGGKNEIRRLTITGASTANNTITITLNGQTSASIAILSTDNTQNIARKIAATNFSAVGGGWDVYEEGNSVLFISRIADSLGGAYSYNVGVGDSIGAFTFICAGVSAVNTWTYKTDWNKDRALGYQNLPVINFQLGNVFEISFQWLGFGFIQFKIENPSTGFLQDVHHIQYPNTSILTSLQNPNLPLCLYVDKTSAGSDVLVVKTASMGLFINGDNNPKIGSRLGLSAIYNTSSGALTAGTYYNIVTIRNMAIFNGMKNFSEILAMNIGFNFVGASAIKRGGIFTFLANFQLDNTNTLTWTKRSSVTSTMEYCLNTVPIIGGSELYSRICGPNFEYGIDVLPMEMNIIPGIMISLSFKPFQNLSSTEITEMADIGISLSWVQR